MGTDMQSSGDPLDRSHIHATLKRYPALADRIHRAMLIALHSRGLATLDEIYREARRRALRSTVEVQVPEDENVQVAHRWDAEEKRFIRKVVIEWTCRHLSRVEFDDLVNLTRKREKAQSLEEVASLPSVPFGMLARSVKSFCRLPVGLTILPEEESISIRVALIRRIISEQLEFHGVARNYLRIRDFDDLVDRVIGDDERAGLIGGKAAGMLLGARILEEAAAAHPDEIPAPPKTPESFFLRSDVMEQFVRHNGLGHLRDHKYRDIDEIRNEYPLLRDLFKNAEFPPAVVDKLRAALARLGTHPLIVRSSSLLEDRFGTTFAGKYRSVFVSNQGTEPERLTELLGAVVEVYASSLHPDPIHYRRRHNLLDFDESMAVLIQKLVGRRIGDYFLPVWAGVGFSHNPLRRNPRIRPEDGMARVVFGFGTRAVDRVGSDTPRVIPLGVPALRPEVNDADVIRASQQRVDVVNLRKNIFETVDVADVLAQQARIPGLGQTCSTLHHDVLRPMVGDGLMDEPDSMFVTFDEFARANRYPKMLRWCLQRLEEAYGCPVDIEYAFDGEQLYLLQCRPQATRKNEVHVTIPADIAASRLILASNRDVVTGSVHGIEYVVLIDPRDYNAITTDERRREVGVVVRHLNRRLASHRFALFGPGRWGSRDLRLGVHVGYSDIDNAALLVELARRQGDYLPDVSFGSHFFQDLVESDISYLALYPGEPGNVFDEGFFHGTANSLVDLLPDAARFVDIVRVIHVPAVRGRRLNVDMDGEHQRAVGYLDDGESAD